MGEPTPPPAGGTSANLFTLMQAPSLSSILRKAIQHFLAERAHYESAVSVQPELTPISWAGSVDAIFLRSLLRARIFGQSYTDVNDLTDDVIKNRLCNLVGGSKSVSFDDALADVKRNFRLEVSQPDAHLRILMLLTSYLELCERHGWTFVEKAPKAAIKNLVAVL